MKNILIIGAGRSATDLIEYLLSQAEAHDWWITVGDFHLDLAKSKVGAHPRGKAIFFDINEELLIEQYVEKADLVASFLPPDMHIRVARACLRHAAHLVTASYLTEDMKVFNEAAKAQGLIFLNEMGADPGLDHMSAMQHIHAIQEAGGEILAFKSYAGALVAPECNTNPWGYKFTWRPMNVVLAGQGGTARYIRDHKFRYIPYHQLFSRLDEVEVPGGYGRLQAYANRDSLPYRKKYGLEEVPTLIRGTLRVPGFCDAWHALVTLGLTDHSYQIEKADQFSYRDWLEAYLPVQHTEDIELATAQFLELDVDHPTMERLRYLDLFSDKKIGLKKGTPAEILLDLLEKKWVFEESDTDMLVMVHEFMYRQEGEVFRRRTAMACRGLDHQHTAISRTVGLPSGIGIKLILQGVIHSPGVHIPVKKEIYQPILQELTHFGITFEETEERVFDRV
jgi:saccharopine dehydrogenase-like NADP-dependent oxidoreductase